MDEGLYNDLIFMIGELYVQRRLEQMKSSRLQARIEELEKEKEGRER